MKKCGDWVSYTMDEIDEMIRRGESQTDWAAVMTEEELEASIAADPDDIHEALDWSKAIVGVPDFLRDLLRADPVPASEGQEAIRRRNV